MTGDRPSARHQDHSSPGHGPAVLRRALQLTLVAAFVGLAAVACEQPPTGTPDADVDASTTDDGAVLEKDRTVTLDAPGLTEVYEWAVTEDRMAAVDRAGGTVYVFDKGGSLDFVLGENGELGEPMDAAFTPDGDHIVVATLGSPHVHVFDEYGNAVRSFDLPGMRSGLKVETLEDGRIVVLNHRDDPMKERLGLYDLQGNLIERFHPSRSAYYTVPYWESTTERLLATSDERIVAGGNLLYPFDEYDYGGGHVGDIGTAPARWEAPSEPDEGAFTGPDARTEFEEWRRTFTSVSKIAFVKYGIFAVAIEELDPDVLSYDRGTYTLDLFEEGGDALARGIDLPGPLLGGGEGLWVLEGYDADTDTWTITLYEVDQNQL